MENEKSPTVPTAVESATETNGASTPRLDSEIDRANSEFVAGTTLDRQRAPEPPKRGRGRPRRISVVEMDHGAGEASRIASAVPSGQVAGAPVLPPPPPIDLAAVEAMVEGTIGLLDEFAQAVVERAAMLKTNDANFASQAAQKSVMSEKTRALLKVGGVGCAKKYALNYDYMEETALCIGLGIWALGLNQQLKVIKRLPDAAPEKN